MTNQDRSAMATMLLVADMAYRNAREKLDCLSDMVGALETERIQTVELATTLITRDHDPVRDSMMLAAWTTKLRQLIDLADVVKKDAADLADDYGRVAAMGRSTVDAFGVRCRSCGEMVQVANDSWYKSESGCLVFLCMGCATCQMSECRRLYEENSPMVWVVDSDDSEQTEQTQLYCQTHRESIPRGKVSQSVLTRIHGFKHWDRCG